MNIESALYCTKRFLFETRLTMLAAALKFGINLDFESITDRVPEYDEGSLAELADYLDGESFAVIDYIFKKYGYSKDSTSVYFPYEGGEDFVDSSLEGILDSNNLEPEFEPAAAILSECYDSFDYIAKGWCYSYRFFNPKLTKYLKNSDSEHLVELQVLLKQLENVLVPFGGATDAFLDGNIIYCDIPLIGEWDYQTSVLSPFIDPFKLADVLKKIDTLIA